MNFKYKSNHYDYVNIIILTNINAFKLTLQNDIINANIQYHSHYLLFFCGLTLITIIADIIDGDAEFFIIYLMYVLSNMYTFAQQIAIFIQQT